MTNIRGVLLDIDGTLVDSNDAHAHAWQEALARGGYSVPFDKVRAAIGMGSDNLLPALIGVKKDTEQGKQLSKWWKGVFEHKYLPHLKPFPQSHELLKRMKEVRLKLVVASSSEGKMLEQLLKIAGADGLIEDSASTSDARHSKPDPDIVQAALAEIKLPADQALMLGDTPYDIESAGKVGVGVVAVRCGGWGDADLKGAVAIYNGPADLLAHFEESPFVQEH